MDIPVEAKRRVLRLTGCENGFSYETAMAQVLKEFPDVTRAEIEDKSLADVKLLGMPTKIRDHINKRGSYGT